MYYNYQWYLFLKPNYVLISFAFVPPANHGFINPGHFMSFYAFFSMHWKSWLNFCASFRRFTDYRWDQKLLALKFSLSLKRNDNFLTYRYLSIALPHFLINWGETFKSNNINNSNSNYYNNKYIVNFVQLIKQLT